MSEVTKAILLDDTGKEIKEALDVIAEAIKNQQGGGSSVAWVQDVGDGDKIATITINGTPTEVYVPKRYEKPEDGIPKADLDTEVQESLNNADSAYQKPSTGIPESDLALDVYQKLANLDSDGEIDYSHVKNTPNLDLKADKSTTYTKTEVDNKVDSTANTSTVASDGTVTFNPINVAKTYELYVDVDTSTLSSGASPVGIETITLTGTGTSGTLKYKLTNAKVGATCKLREIKL